MSVGWAWPRGAGRSLFQRADWSEDSVRECAAATDVCKEPQGHDPGVCMSGAPPSSHNHHLHHPCCHNPQIKESELVTN